MIRKMSVSYTHLDVYKRQIIAQAPKMRPYIDTMRENIAKALKIDIDQVNVKATTEEGLSLIHISRKRGEQTGLDTLVVHAVNDDY